MASVPLHLSSRPKAPWALRLGPAFGAGDVEASPPASRIPRHLEARRRTLWQSGHWPLGFRPRTALRLALCLPYVALALWCARRGIDSPTNVAIARQGASVRWGSSQLSWIGDAYPPVPVAIASLVPGGATLLGVAGALCAGGMLQMVWERLVRAGLPWWVIAPVLAGLGGTPVFWFVATQDLVGFVGMALFTIALAGLLDFVLRARTAGGFTAGLALALAVLTDPAALVYAASVFVAAPLLVLGRLGRDRAALRSALAVIVFPALAAACGWAFFQWRFTGVPFHLPAVAPSMFRFPAGVVAPLRDALVGVGKATAYSPLFLLSAVLLLRRRPLAFAAYLLVPIDLVLTLWLGLRVSDGQSLVLMNLVAVFSLPTRPGRTTRGLIVAAALAQVAIWCTAVLGHGAIAPWLHALTA